MEPASPLVGTAAKEAPTDTAETRHISEAADISPIYKWLVQSIIEVVRRSASPTAEASKSVLANVPVSTAEFGAIQQLLGGRT